VTAETPEGDLISALGNKSTNGEPLTIDEFIVENDEDGSTFVLMNDNGTVESAQGKEGLRIDFTWDDNDPSIIYTSIVVNNGSQQLSIRINLTEPVDPENVTNYISEISSSPSKRSINAHNSMQRESTDWPKARSKGNDFESPVKRQSGTQTSNYADVFVNVEACNTPEPNAKVFADILVDYDVNSRSFDRKVKYWGKQSLPGRYTIQIPTSKASVIGEELGNICDNVNVILGKMCETYSKINNLAKLWTNHDVDSLFCFYVGNGLRLIYPALRLIPIHRFCKNIFKPFKAYCKHGDSDIPGTGKSIADIVCDGIPLVDNGIDFLREKDILFTPTAIFPLGNQVQATGQVLTVPPGRSNVSQQFTIMDNDALTITEFSVVPEDPLPGENYVVTVSYNCFLTETFLAQMSIVGTDNYTDTVICYTGPTCVLYVPGADALVRDEVDINIQNGQSSASRMVVIIF